jgi:hypothetical protein
MIEMPWDGICRNKKLVKCGNETIDVGGDRLVTEWIEPRSYGASRVFAESVAKAKEWAEEYKAYGYPLEHYLIYAIWGWVNKNVAYKPDVYEKYPDYWNEPSETYAEREGDCEDASILCQSAIECALPYETTKKSYTKLAIGYFVQGDNWYGHAWVYYDSEAFGRRVVLECTLDDYVPPNAYYSGIPYHPTILATSKSWEVVCTCEKCKIMLQYLSGVATKRGVNWRRGVAEFLALEEAKPLPWWRRLRPYKPKIKLF